MKSGLWRGAAFRLLAVALAIGTVSDGRTSRVAYAQGVTDPTVVKARAAINRGQYAEAEALLKPLAAQNPEGEAALELGLFYEMIGRRDESRALLQRVSNIQAGARTSAAEYARLGRAARALGEFQLANDAYRIAVEKAPGDPAVHTGWGELFLQVHNNAEAVKSFQDALQADDKWIPALLGVAQALLGVNPPAAEKAVQQALSLDPDAVAGHLLAAQIELDRSNREAAKAAIAKAKAVNPAGLDAIALSGAVAYIEDRHSDFQQETSVALKINPRFSDAYRVAGDLAAANYRFEEAVALSRRALELDSERRTHARGPWRAAAADRRRGRSAHGAREGVCHRQVRSDDVQPADDARLARQVPDDRRRQHHRQAPSRRNGGDARVRRAARARGAGDLLEEV